MKLTEEQLNFFNKNQNNGMIFVPLMANYVDGIEKNPKDHSLEVIKRNLLEFKRYNFTHIKPVEEDGITYYGGNLKLTLNDNEETQRLIYDWLESARSEEPSILYPTSLTGYILYRDEEGNFNTLAFTEASPRIRSDANIIEKKIVSNDLRPNEIDLTCKFFESEDLVRLIENTFGLDSE